jgi:hypothetical protein
VVMASPKALGALTLTTKFDGKAERPPIPWRVRRLPHFSALVWREWSG